MVLKDVRHAPDLPLNLISLGRLNEDGFDGNFGGGKWKVAKGPIFHGS